ncbi:MAG TPA: response regulator [Planctomycetota bacterium]
MELPREPREKESEPRVMLVEDDPGVSYAILRWLKGQKARAVLATTTGQAMEWLRDMKLIESAFDGVLVDYHLPDATGLRLVQHFHEECPALPVAMMSGSNDICLEVWTTAHGVPLFRKPLVLTELEGWLAAIRGPQRRSGLANAT